MRTTLLVATLAMASTLSFANAADTPNDKRPTLNRPHAAGRGRPGARVDQRETRQQKRIDEGIKHGQLTTDEVAALQKQEQSIQTLENSFKTDGKLTRDEAKQLQKALNDASLQIWAQRHDTEGNQKPVIRLGKDIFANSDLTSKIEGGELSRTEARQFLQDFRKMVSLKRRLSSENLSADQRIALQNQYNGLLNEYFFVK